MTPTQVPDPGFVFDAFLSYQRTAALNAAIELDLFRALGDEPVSAAAIAQSLGCSERGVRILCDYLTINRLIEKVDGKYRHTPTSAVFLDPRSPACLASVSRFLAVREMQEPYHQLAEVVRSGHTTLPGQGSVEPENPVWVEFAHSMAPMVAPMAGPLAEIVLAGRNGAMRVLDIAAGHGLFGIEIAKRNPEARVVALDWAAVLEVARENAQKAGVGERVELLPGSAFDVEYGGPYDAVLLTNFLHHFDQATCVSLLKKVHAALKPGGVAATLEFVPNDDRISPPMPAAFSLVMLASTASGDAYTFREFESMHRDAGFREVAQHPLPNLPGTVITARKS